MNRPGEHRSTTTGEGSQQRELRAGELRLGIGSLCRPTHVDLDPSELGPGSQLSRYASSFETAELTASLDASPAETELRSLADDTPDGFLFAVAVQEVELTPETPRRMVQLLDHLQAALGEKLGPVLLEIEDEGSAEQLVETLAGLPPFDRWAVELPSPLSTPRVLSFLRERAIALCLSERRDGPSSREVTAPHIYVALREPTMPRRDRWDGQSIVGWACALKSWLDDGREVFCYLDVADAAGMLEDLRALRRMTSGTADELDCP